MRLSATAVCLLAFCNIGCDSGSSAESGAAKEPAKAAAADVAKESAKSAEKTPKKTSILDSAEFMGRKVKLQSGGGDFAEDLNMRGKGPGKDEALPPHEPDGIFLDINGETLTWKALDRRVDLLLLKNPLNLPPEATKEQVERVIRIARRKYAENIANRYVREALLAQKARAAGLTASPDEIKGAMKLALKKTPKNVQAEILKDLDDKDSCFYREQENYLLSKKYRHAAIDPQISVTEKDVSETVRKRDAEIAQLKAKKAAMRPQLETWLGEIRAGKRDFGKTAYDFSDDTSSMEDGVMGDFRRGDNELERPLRDFAFAASKEELSGVIETERGYHILKVLARRYDGEAGDDEEDEDGGKPKPQAAKAGAERRPTVVTLAQIMLEKPAIPEPYNVKTARAATFKRKVGEEIYNRQLEALRQAKIECAVPVTLLKNTERKIRMARKRAEKALEQKTAEQKKGQDK